MWYDELGSKSEYVISTRVRIARNFEDFKFPNAMNNKEMNKLVSILESFVDSSKFSFLKLKDMDKITIASLVEKHLISFELANNINSALIINKENDISVMILEEDHLRIQAFSGGLNILDTYNKAKYFENNINLKYAISEKYGFLSACPTNVGSGLRISIMMHLPGLKNVNKIAAISENMRSQGILIRGSYGENTNTYADMYQISNISSLGLTDENIINNLNDVIEYVIKEEEKARKYLLNKNIEFEDNIHRAYGILKNCRYVSYSEAVKLLSYLRVGISLDIIKNTNLNKVNKLLFEIGLNVIKTISKEDLSEYKENIMRAEYIRKELD